MMQKTFVKQLRNKKPYLNNDHNFGKMFFQKCGEHLLMQNFDHNHLKMCNISCFAFLFFNEEQVSTFVFVFFFSKPYWTPCPIVQWTQTQVGRALFTNVESHLGVHLPL